MIKKQMKHCSYKKASKKKIITTIIVETIVVLVVVGVGRLILSSRKSEPIQESPEFKIPSVESLPTGAEVTETPTPETTPVPTWDVVPSLGDDIDPEPTPFVLRTSSEDIELIARTIWGEAPNVTSTMEQAGVAWCILNRVDSSRFPDTIEGVVTQPQQFHGYRSAARYGDCPEYYIDLAADVVERWEREAAGETDVGRVLPAEYLYFEGDMTAHNYFRTEWLGGLRWWWTAENPYDD